MYVHRTAIFTPDGVARYAGVKCWSDPGGRPVPQDFSNETHPQTYTLSLEDDLDHWFRLWAEIVTHFHADPAVAQHGDPTRLRHVGGAAHPTHAHIRVGGVLQWGTPAHPVVAHLAAQHQARPPQDFYAFHAGPLVSP